MYIPLEWCHMNGMAHRNARKSTVVQQLVLANKEYDTKLSSTVYLYVDTC